MAQQAAAESAPVVRLADRGAAWFLPLALGVAAFAWLISGSAERAVAVLVVATPCPLLLAAPVAIVSGLSRASRLGVVIRDGGALENLGRATTLVLDKTGTVTTGRPRGTDVLVAPGWTPSEVLRLAASADQVSPHVLARAIVEEAATRGLPLSMPADVVEEAGKGVTATVDGRRVTVGAAQLSSDAPPWAHAAESRAAFDGAALTNPAAGGPLPTQRLHGPARAGLRRPASPEGDLDPAEFDGRTRRCRRDARAGPVPKQLVMATYLRCICRVTAQKWCHAQHPPGRAGVCFATARSRTGK
jgi:hypothetical protein